MDLQIEPLYCPFEDVEKPEIIPFIIIDISLFVSSR
jgi:hypothetical protein